MNVFGGGGGYSQWGKSGYINRAPIIQGMRTRRGSVENIFVPCRANPPTEKRRYGGLGQGEFQGESRRWEFLAGKRGRDGGGWCGWVGTG